MGKARPLTSGEVAAARQAFGDGIDYPRVRLREGTGANPAAGIALLNGNPAITLGPTVYFIRDFAGDFSAAGKNLRSFMHEMTHVWQYQRMGMTRFLLRYAREFARVGGRASHMYRYRPGITKFGDAMLEAQAQMVGDYAGGLLAGDKAAKNLAGSGIYGF